MADFRLYLILSLMCLVIQNESIPNNRSILVSFKSRLKKTKKKKIKQFCFPINILMIMGFFSCCFFFKSMLNNTFGIFFLIPNNLLKMSHKHYCIYNLNSLFKIALKSEYFTYVVKGSVVKALCCCSEACEIKSQHC